MLSDDFTYGGTNNMGGREEMLLTNNIVFLVIKNSIVNWNDIRF